MKENETIIFKSYGPVMRGYVLVPEKLLDNLKLLSPFLTQSYNYVKSLEPKATKK